MKKLTKRKVGLTLAMAAIISQWAVGMYACKKWEQECTLALKYKSERDALICVKGLVTRIIAAYGTDEIDKLIKLGARKDEINLMKQWHKMCQSFAEE